MSRLERRLRRYAIYAAAHAVAVAAYLAAPGSPVTTGLVLISAVPLIFAWGHFHVDLARNGALREGARWRWRILFWLMPWSMAAYWLRYVRPRTAL